MHNWSGSEQRSQLPDCTLGLVMWRASNPLGLVLLRASNTDPTAAGQHAVLIRHPAITLLCSSTLQPGSSCVLSTKDVMPT